MPKDVFLLIYSVRKTPDTSYLQCIIRKNAKLKNFHYNMLFRRQTRNVSRVLCCYIHILLRNLNIVYNVGTKLTKKSDLKAHLMRFQNLIVPKWLRGKMRICREDSYATKEHREGRERFVKYELPSAVYIYPHHLNTNANFETLTTKLVI